MCRINNEVLFYFSFSRTLSFTHVHTYVGVVLTTNDSIPDGILELASRISKYLINELEEIVPLALSKVLDFIGIIIIIINISIIIIIVDVIIFVAIVISFLFLLFFYDVVFVVLLIT